MIRTSMYQRNGAYSNDTEAVPPLPNGRNIAPRQRQQQNGYGGDVGYQEPQRVIQLVDYLATVDTLDKPRPELVVELESSARGRIVRMFTVYPYKDMNWIVAVLFVVGSMSFVTNGIFNLLPPVSKAIGPATLTTGSILFTIAGTLGIFAAFNANRGTIEVTKGGVGTYRPALVGSSSWVWFPSSADLILGVSTVSSFPGVFKDSTSNPTLFQALAFLPKVIGGSILVVAFIGLLVFLQDSWYKPKPSSPDWLGTFLNTVGSAGFGMTGVFLLLRDGDRANQAALFGSSFFLSGTIVGLYSLMEFHPDAWAA
ncbi:hypothetical protein MCOR27_000055 [Pyricularia oryzae]|uniref:Integral membrane protein n=1 Tax=Pyricularia grisea TaxID=148305 RepID=A0ABQ8NUJ0_PYRGI|nr:hypothetical protein MCOR01_006743 [Pyricularia oryzae]KAI6302313.1 hypothetical protein MCOR33_002342 [Pyricularia grisea]KAH9436062.1 hypothetical protein MCOR02_004971 [Pyricularia oryzae]KAI6257065.1 hypothetical protein MCOR19_006511 [Pyricularia oryzae]KAI6287374.1 hypothetical protein MCOR26_000626 [Pyricularia oryzae]